MVMKSSFSGPMLSRALRRAMVCPALLSRLANGSQAPSRNAPSATARIATTITTRVAMNPRMSVRGISELEVDERDRLRGREPDERQDHHARVGAERDRASIRKSMLHVPVRHRQVEQDESGEQCRRCARRRPAGRALCRWRRSCRSWQSWPRCRARERRSRRSRRGETPPASAGASQRWRAPSTRTAVTVPIAPARDRGRAGRPRSRNSSWRRATGRPAASWSSGWRRSARRRSGCRRGTRTGSRAASATATCASGARSRWSDQRRGTDG